MSTDSDRNRLDRAADAIERATELCTRPSFSRMQQCRLEIESAAELLSGIPESAAHASEEFRARLRSLKGRVANLTALHRQAVWLLRGAAQSGSEAFLAYSSTNTEPGR